MRLVPAAATAAVLLLPGCVAGIGVAASQLSNEDDLRRETARSLQVAEEDVEILSLDDRIIVSREKRQVATILFRARVEGVPQACRYRAIGVSCDEITEEAATAPYEA